MFWRHKVYRIYRGNEMAALAKSWPKLCRYEMAKFGKASDGKPNEKSSKSLQGMWNDRIKEKIK